MNISTFPGTFSAWESVVWTKEGLGPLGVVASRKSCLQNRSRGGMLSRPTEVHFWFPGSVGKEICVSNAGYQGNFSVSTHQVTWSDVKARRFIFWFPGLVTEGISVSKVYWLLRKLFCVHTRSRGGVPRPSSRGGAVLGPRDARHHSNPVRHPDLRRRCQAAAQGTLARYCDNQILFCIQSF